MDFIMKHKHPVQCQIHPQESVFWPGWVCSFLLKLFWRTICAPLYSSLVLLHCQSLPLDNPWTIQQGDGAQEDKVVLPSSKIIHVLLWLRVMHLPDNNADGRKESWWSDTSSFCSGQSKVFVHSCVLTWLQSGKDVSFRPDIFVRRPNKTHSVDMLRCSKRQ